MDCRISCGLLNQDPKSDRGMDLHLEYYFPSERNIEKAQSILSRMVKPSFDISTVEESFFVEECEVCPFCCGVVFWPTLDSF